MNADKQPDPPTFTVYKIKKKRMEFQTILLLTFCLALMILLTLHLRQNQSAVKQIEFNLPTQQTCGVMDSLYFHKPLHFIVRSPHSTWKFQTLNSDTLVKTMDTTAIVWDQIQWLVRLSPVHDSVNVNVRMGILKGPAKIDDKNLTISMLAEMLKMHQDNSRHVRIITPVTQPAHHLLQGAFFVIAVPRDPIPVVRVVSLLTRENTAYIFDCQVVESKYALYRQDLQKLIAGFMTLPKMKI